MQVFWIIGIIIAGLAIFGVVRLLSSGGSVSGSTDATVSDEKPSQTERRDRR